MLGVQIHSTQPRPGPADACTTAQTRSKGKAYILTYIKGANSVRGACNDAADNWWASLPGTCRHTFAALLSAKEHFVMRLTSILVDMCFARAARARHRRLRGLAWWAREHPIPVLHDFESGELDRCHHVCKGSKVHNWGLEAGRLVVRERQGAGRSDLVWFAGPVAELRGPYPHDGATQACPL